MPDSVILILSLLACLLNCTIRKFYTAKWPDTPASRHIINAVNSVTAAVILFFWGGISSVSVFTVLLGIAFGVVTALQTVCSLKAYSLGSWAYTTVITSLSMLIPALSGCLFWQEQLLWPQIIGIVLLVVCLFLSVEKDEKDKEKKAVSLRWLLFCAIAFLMGGLIGVMQKVHQSSDYKEELNAFLVISFAVSFLYSGVCSLKGMKSEIALRSKKEWALILPLLVLGGAGVAVNNKLNLYLSGVMDSAVFFPVFNGANLIATMLLAIWLFRERLSRRQWIGIAIGIVSVILLCNPFA